MSSSRGQQVSPSGGGSGGGGYGPLVRCGHLRKLKTLKKKYFVLRGDAPGRSACLEYYDTKKKFDNRQPPKRSISMRSCFNINRRVDTKHTHVIALYTKDECFSLILESEKDLEDWLNAMLLLSGDVPDGEQPRPTFEHVWQVNMQKKGLGERKNIHGPYRLCLTDRTLSLVKVGAKDNSDPIEFSLVCIRRCGYMERIFYMEVGRSAVTGGGDFWMEAEDNNIAYNMHVAILSAMSSSSSNSAAAAAAAAAGLNTSAGAAGSLANKDDVGPRQRVRSSSANEASKPISVLQRRHTGAKLHGFSPLEEQRSNKEQVDPLLEQYVTASAPSQCSQSQSTSSSNTLTGATGRDRCDSLPSRARTTSEGHPIPAVVLGHPRGGHLAPHVPRPHSMYGRGLSYSPPVSSMPISPASGACSTDSAGSSLSMDDGADNGLEEATTLSRYGHSVTPDEPAILEENLDDYAPWSSSHQPHKYSPNFKSHSPSQQSSYVEMYSPCGSSPGRSASINAAYMPMSPATGATSSIQHQSQPQPAPQQQQQQQQHSHSRASSLVEDTTLLDGYVPMAPVGDDGYVDMDPLNGHGHHNGHFPDDMSQHGSSCSVTSGTPSTDLRFSEYHLDKVTSYLAPGEETPARPTRAYSVGSRPEPANRHRKNRLDIAQQEASRVRAFSVGSRSKRPEIIGRLASVIASRLSSGAVDSTSTNKSNSAPLLSSSWGHNSGCSAASERMEDLMELDFTKPNHTQESVNSPPSSSYSQSHSQSYSTATDTSSYVDMSPGQAHASSVNNATAPYVDMGGNNKINRNNSNNNNNTTTANHNHNHAQATNSIAAIIHKPGLSILKPVEEADAGAYMRMKASLDDWPRAGSSPKQAPSPMQDDYMQMNGPPGMTRTAPVDLPQPRRPPDGYVDMTFKSRPSLDQDYIKMSMGVVVGSGDSGDSAQSSGSRARTRRTREVGNRSEKSQRSQPIAIQASAKASKTPSFLPLNGSSPTSESLGSTPASPPRATPTGSNATIFPFSLNSPQSPIKPFDTSSRDETTTSSNNNNSGSGNNSGNKIYASQTALSDDYALVESSAASSSAPAEVPPSLQTSHDVPRSPLTKRLAELTISRARNSQNSQNLPVAVTSLANDDDTGSSSVNATDKTPESSTVAVGFASPNHRQTEISQSPASARRGTDVTFAKMKNSRGNFAKDEATASGTIYEQPNANSTLNTQQEMPKSPLAKRLGDLSVVKAKLVHPSPNTSPTPSAGFKIVQKTQSTGKIADEGSGAAAGSGSGSGGGTTTPTPTPTPIATPSPLDSEGYEKLQPGATILHYASLDLPEVVGAPPVSPTPVTEGFSYAEIDFAKLKQN